MIKITYRTILFLLTSLGLRATIDPNIFLHHLGDLFGEDSGYEGYEREKAVEFRKTAYESLLRNHAHWFPKNLLERLIEQSASALKLSNSFDNGTHEETRNLLKKKLDSLDVGHFVFFSLGWPHHAVQYQILRETNATYCLRLYNLGQGVVQYHSFSFINSQTLFSPFLGVCGVTKNRFATLSFVAMVREITKPGSQFGSIENLYEILLASLGGQYEYPSSNLLLYKRAQSSGTCSYAALPAITEAAIRSYFPKLDLSPIAAKIEVFIGLYLLEEAIQDFQPWDFSKLELYKKGLTSLASNTASLNSVKTIDLDFLEYALSRIEQSLSSMAKIEQKLLESMGSQSLPALKNSNLGLIMPEAKFDWARKEAEDLSHTAVYQPNEVHSPRSLKEQYLRLKNIWQVDRLWVLNQIERLAIKLSLQKSHWKGADPAEAIEILAKLAELYLATFSNHYLLSNLPGAAVQSKNYLTLLKLLSVADLLNPYHSDQAFPRMPPIIDLNALRLLSGKTSLLQTHDHRWHQQIRELRQYYNASQSQKSESFFGFERIPADECEGVRLFTDDKIAPQALSLKDWSIKHQYTWLDLNWAREWTHRYLPRYEGYDSLPIEPYKYYCGHDFVTQIARTDPLIELNRNTMNVLRNKKLPTVFYDLYRLAAALDYLMKGEMRSYSLVQGSLEFGIGVSVRDWTTHHEEESSRYSCPRQVSAREVAQFNQYELKPDFFGLGKKCLHQGHHLDTTPLSSNLDYFWRDIEVEPFPLRRRMPSNEVMLSVGPGIKMSSLEQTRNLLRISSNSETQLLALIDFFTLEPRYLSSPTHQAFFAALLQEPTILLENQDLLDVLSVFFEKQILDAKRVRSVPTIAFLLKMKQWCGLSGAIEEIWSLIGVSDLNSSLSKEHLLPALLYMLANKNSLSISELRLLLVSSISKPTERAALERHRQQLEKLVSSSDVHELFDFVVDTLNPIGERLEKWQQIKDGCCRARFVHGTVELDVISGHLHIIGGAQVPLPVPDSVMRAAFGQQAKVPELVFQNKRNEYHWEWQNLKGHDVFARKWWDNTWNFQMQLLESESQETWLYDGIFYWNEDPRLDVRVAYRFPTAPDNLTYVEEFNAYEYISPKKVKGLDPRLQFTGTSYWEKVNPTYCDELKIQVLDLDTFTPKYQILCNDFTSVKRYSDKLELATSLNSSILEPFLPIEDFQQIRFWGNNNKIEEVEIPRLGMTFKSSNQGLECATLSDYLVSKKQIFPGLDLPINYVVCESKQNPADRVALAPLFHLKRISKSLTPIFETKFGDTYGKPAIYRLNSEGQVISDSSLAQYYLVLRQLHQRKHRQAAHTLRTGFNLVFPNTPEENRLLELIATEIDPDKDPRALGVQLLSVYYRLANQRMFAIKSVPSPRFFEKSRQLFERYQPNQFMIDEFFISQGELSDLKNWLAILVKASDCINRVCSTQKPPTFKKETKILNIGDAYLAGFLEEKNYIVPDLSYSSILKPKNLFSDNTLPLLYAIAGGGEFNQTQARHLLESLLHRPIPDLTKTEIATEFRNIVDSRANLDRFARTLMKRFYWGGFGFAFEPPQIHRSYVLMPDFTSLPRQPELKSQRVVAALPAASSGFEDPLFRPIVSAEDLESVVQAECPLINMNGYERLFDRLGASFLTSVQTIREQLRCYTSRFEHEAAHFTNVDWERFISPDMSQMEDELKRMESELLESAKQIPAGDRIFQYADLTPFLTIGSLIQNSLKECSSNNRLTEFLAKSTYLNHVQQFERARIEAHESCANSFDAPICQNCFKKVLGLAKTKRAYLVGSKPVYLAFEYFTGMLIREEQIDAVEHLKSNTQKLGALIEMAMGTGKSSVLLPLLAITDSHDKLKVVLLPEALLPQMVEQLDRKLARISGQEVVVLQSSRSKKRDITSLSFLYSQLKRAHEASHIVVTSNSDLQSLFLEFIDRLRLQSDSKEARILFDIFSLFRSSGILTIDEIDSELDIYQSHHFGVGGSRSITLDPNLKLLAVLAVNLYREISTNPILHQSLDFPFLQTRGDNAITESNYKAWVGTLVEEILSEKFIHFDRSISHTYRKMIQTKDVRKAAKDYLNNISLNSRDKLMELLKDDTERNIFSILFEEIHYVLPITLNKKLAVHYGPLSPASISEKNQYLAIPYHRGQPMNQSRFGNPLEALNYSIQMALSQSGYRTYLEKDRTAIQDVARKNPTGLWKSRFIDRLHRLDSDAVVLEATQISESQIQSLFERLQTPSAIDLQLEYFLEYAAQQIRINSLQLSTNSQVYGNLFSEVRGFSGTLWNDKTFPLIFREPQHSDTTIKTLHALWTDHLADPRPIVELDNHRPILEQIYTNFSGSLIDEAGLFRTASNPVIAKEIEKSTHRPVSYYDEDNRFIDGGAQSVAYWDKKHTIGSDIHLAPNMTASMTVDKHLTMQSFQQAAWRLRSLGTGQRIERYFVLKEDQEVIRSRLLQNRIEPTLEKGLGLEDLVLYAILNEHSLLTDSKIRSAKKKLQNLMLKQHFSDLFSSNSFFKNSFVDVFVKLLTGNSLLERSYASHRNLYEQSFDSNKLWTRFGRPVSEEVSMRTVLEEEKARLTAKKRDPALQKGMSQLIDRLLTDLPTAIRHRQGGLDELYESETQVEVEEEAEEETRQEQQDETEQEEIARIKSALASKKPRDVVPWTLQALPIQSVRQALTSYSLDKLTTFIDSDLYCSLNWVPDSNNIDGFFGIFYKPIHNLLLIQEDSSNAIRGVLIDDNDLAFFRELLRGDISLWGNWRLAVYSLTMHRVLWKTQKEIVFEQVPKSFFVQSAYLAGHSSFPNDLLPALRIFLGNSEQSEFLETLFTKQILLWKHESIKSYMGSHLEEALTSSPP